jgi:ketosteroid isomerase-like protein
MQVALVLNNHLNYNQMKTSIRILISGFLMIFITWVMTSCQPNKSSVTETDIAAIREWNDKGLTMVKELNKDNAEAFVKYTYAEDAIAFPPNAKSLKGQQALIELYQNYPVMSDFNQEIEEIEVFGDWAYLRLNWSINMNQPEPDIYKDSGIIFVILRKQEDKSWKIWREIFNSDVPLPVSQASN